MDVASHPDWSFLRVAGGAGSRGLSTVRGFRQREVLGTLPCTAHHSRPTRHTVQVDESGHIEVGVLATLNHSCDPNLLLDTTRMLVIAARDIAPGEELTYFYPSTEWDMAEAFACRCGSAGCLEVIRGARYLPAATLGRYFINRHLLAMRQEPPRRSARQRA